MGHSHAFGASQTKWSALIARTRDPSSHFSAEISRRRVTRSSGVWPTAGERFARPRLEYGLCMAAPATSAPTPASRAFRQARAVLDEHTALARAGTGWNLHEFRHTALTHLGEAEARPMTLMAKSRHKETDNVRRYFHPQPRGARRVTSLLGSGDTLKITRLDRLSRSAQHLINLGADLRATPTCASPPAAYTRPRSVHEYGITPIPGPRLHGETETAFTRKGGR
jgi:hypothetical protein